MLCYMGHQLADRSGPTDQHEFRGFREGRISRCQTARNIAIKGSNLHAERHLKYLSYAIGKSASCRMKIIEVIFLDIGNEQ